jgi:hypothetical protein
MEHIEFLKTMQAEMREEMMAIMDANQESLEVNLDAD